MYNGISTYITNGTNNSDNNNNNNNECDKTTEANKHKFDSCSFKVECVTATIKHTKRK